MIVDLFGNAPPREAICRLAARHDLRVIEDCAQSTGAYAHGRRVGAFDIGCHSFGEIKNMTSAEGGMLTTNDDEVARRARLLRHSGELWRTTRHSTIGGSPSSLTEMIRGIDYEFVGTNFRMNALQAALGKSQLGRLDSFNAEREKIAAQYRAGLKGAPLQGMRIDSDVRAVYNRYPVLLSDQAGLSRDAFLAALIAEGVPAGVYYPMPFNSTSVIKCRSGISGSRFPFDCGHDLEKNYDRPFAGAERACEQHVLLPCYPGLAEQDVRDVIAACEKVLERVAGHATEVEAAALSAKATYFGQFFSSAQPC
jgi:dTDP-4-amino-4,6-dideoxygalactose transaminase